MSSNKTIVSVYADAGLINLAHQKGMNVSGEFNEFLKMRLITIVPEQDNKIEVLTRLATETENKLIAIKKQLDDAKSSKVISDNKINNEKLEKYKKELGWE